MSREVEVQNIQMTATTPEDVQLSLGEIADHDKAKNLAMSTGVLATSGTAAKTPTHDYDWSNTADVSAYYSFGKLIPASSINGTNIFFTPDANGVGKTVKADGMFYQAAAGLTAQNASTAASGGSGTLNATSHIFSDESEKSNMSWTATKATAWNITNDDGYYIDIPVWLRTSAESVSLGVQAYVTDAASATAHNQSGAKTDTATQDGELLYRAVRTAVLDYAGTSISSLIPVADGSSGAVAGYYGGKSIIDYYNRSGSSKPETNENLGQAVNKTGSGAVYAAPVQYNSGATTVPTAAVTQIITLKSNTPGQYGDAQQFIIRVWLEGEDPDCWNDTAGQDWSINLKFVKID